MVTFVPGQMSCGDGGRHRRGHRGRIGGAGHRGGQQHGVAAQFHRQRGVTGGTDARVQDHRDVRRIDDHLDMVRVRDAQAGADG